MEDYFKDCMDEEQLRARYRELCVKMHPDRNPGNPDATAEFQEMQQQYEERKAELAGDYKKARKGRERRAQAERERRERERKERERRKVEQVVEQARLNRQKSHRDLKAGDYVYARGVNFTRSMFDWDHLCVDELLHVLLKKGVKEDCVVYVETVVELDDDTFMVSPLSHYLPEGVWGGWEAVQAADPASGISKP